MSVTPNRRTRQRIGIFATGLLAITSVVVTAQPADALTGTAVIDGSFVQPALIDSMSSTQLATEDSDLTRAGLTKQILQWTADSLADTTIYPSGLTGYTQNTSTDVLGRTLSAADTQDSPSTSGSPPTATGGATTRTTPHG